MRYFAAVSVLLTFALTACGGGGGGGGEGDDPGRQPDPPGQSGNAPTISGDPDTTVVVGSAYAFEPDADDADGDALTFSIQNKPDWANFNTGSGRLAGTPGAGDLGATEAIRISVSDGSNTRSLAAFDIDVTNSMPQISGTPTSTVLAGAAFAFEPSASDADGHDLTFSIQNKPDWATFDSATGSLTGTPGAGDAGTSPPITITVSDGYESQSMAPFTLNVLAVGAWSTTLTWTPPTSNEDDTALNDLAGYKVYYGTEPANFEVTVDVPNPGISSYVVQGLTSPTYYFAVTAYDNDGNESLFSNVVSRTLN